MTPWRAVQLRVVLLTASVALVVGASARVFFSSHSPSVPAKELVSFLHQNEQKYDGRYVELVTTLDFRLARYVLQNLDAFYAAMEQRYFPGTGRARLTFYLTKTVADAEELVRRRRGQAFARREALGVYFGGHRLAVTYFDAAERGIMPLMSTAFHETIHHLVHLTSPDAPHWFHEGLAGFLGDGSTIIKGRLLDGYLDPWNEEFALFLDPETIDIERLIAERDPLDQRNAATLGRVLFCWLHRRGRLSEYLTAVRKDGFGMGPLLRTGGVNVPELNWYLRQTYQTEVIPMAVLYWGMTALHPDRRTARLLSALHRAPDAPRIRYELAKHYYRQGQSTVAADVLAPALARPDYPEFRLAAWLMGDILMAQVRPNEAVRHYLLALDFAEYDEHEYQLMRRLTLCLDRLGLSAVAQGWLRQAAQRDWSAGLHPEQWSEFGLSYPVLQDPLSAGPFRFISTMDPRFIRHAAEAANGFWSQVEQIEGLRDLPSAVTVYYMETPTQARALANELELPVPYDQDHGAVIHEPPTLILHHRWGDSEGQTTAWRLLFEQLGRVAIRASHPDCPGWFEGGWGQFLSEAMLRKGHLSLTWPSEHLAVRLIPRRRQQWPVQLAGLIAESDRPHDSTWRASVDSDAELMAWWQATKTRPEAAALFRWLYGNGHLPAYLHSVQDTGYGAGSLERSVRLPLDQIEAAVGRLIDEAYGPRYGIVETRLAGGQRAVTAYERLLKQHPDMLDARVELMLRYLAAGRFQQALEVAEPLLQRPDYPGYPLVHRNAAGAWRRLGRPDRQLHHLLCALDMADEDPIRYQLLKLIGEAYQELGHPDLARGWLRAYLAADWEMARHPQFARLVKRTLPEFQHDWDARDLAPIDQVW